jgi:hypothetical protein
MEAICNAFLNSGFFSKRLEFSRVEASSVHLKISLLDLVMELGLALLVTHPCKPARTLAQMEGWTCLRISSDYLDTIVLGYQLILYGKFWSNYSVCAREEIKDR